jgi:hypothetical protein
MISKNFIIDLIGSKNYKILETIIILFTFALTIGMLFSYPVSNLILIFFIVLSLIFLILSIVVYLWFNKDRIPITSRFNFTIGDLKNYISKSSKSIKILCIFLTWADILIPLIFENLELDHHIKIEILLVKRKRKPSDISYIKMREDDEDDLMRAQYVPEINKTLWLLFTNLLDMHLHQPGIIRNLEIKEYEFMPSVCMYIFDDKKLVFGPYIAKICNKIPMMEINSSAGLKFMSSENCLAFSELSKHYKILSGRDLRGNKDYPFRFCYYDGTNNISIHLLIENNTHQLNTILTRQTRDDYQEFLIGRNDTYKDKIMSDLLNDCNEGRFDAVLRHISDRLEVYRQNPPQPDNWLEEILTIVSMAKRSAMHILDKNNEFEHSKRLTDLNDRLKLVENQMGIQQIDQEWIKLTRDLSRALVGFNKTQKSLIWITDLQKEITDKWGKMVS